MRISDWSSDVCSSDLFDVRRPTELADRLDPIECIATLYQFLCIACKRTGITRNISNLWHHRLRQRGRLVAGTRTRRIEHHRLEPRSEEHTSELQSLMRISYAVFCLKKKNKEQLPIEKAHRN